MDGRISERTGGDEGHSCGGKWDGWNGSNQLGLEGGMGGVVFDVFVCLLILAKYNLGVFVCHE